MMEDNMSQVHTAQQEATQFQMRSFPEDQVSPHQDQSNQDKLKPVSNSWPWECLDNLQGQMCDARFVH